MLGFVVCVLGCFGLFCLFWVFWCFGAGLGLWWFVVCGGFVLCCVLFLFVLLGCVGAFCLVFCFLGGVGWFGGGLGVVKT